MTLDTSFVAVNVCHAVSVCTPLEADLGLGVRVPVRQGCMGVSEVRTRIAVCSRDVERYRGSFVPQGRSMLTGGEAVCASPRGVLFSEPHLAAFFQLAL